MMDVTMVELLVELMAEWKVEKKGVQEEYLLVVWRVY